MQHTNLAKTPHCSTISPVIIDSAAAMRINKGNITFYEKSLMTRNDIWHKVQVFHGGLLEKEVVLQSILMAVSPNDLIPIKYTKAGEDSYFLVRNCDSALQQLCRSNLIVKSCNDQLLLLTITLGFASIHDLKVNIRPLLLVLLTKRYSQNKKSLILDHFHRDPEVFETVFCPLSQHRTLNSVLNIANKDLAPFEHMSLQYNNLTNLLGMENVVLNNLKCLDLRHNSFLNVESLAPLKNFNITELLLDSNPLCDNYSSPQKYIEAIRQYCPTLSKLDGIYIGSPGLPIISKISIKNDFKRKLVIQFVEHFFTLYDEKDRGILKGLYHPNALYSMMLNSTYAALLRKQFPQPNHEKRNLIIVDMDINQREVQKRIPNILAYENRNLLLPQNKETTKLLYYGEDEILKALKRLPETQHFKSTFSYDLMYNDVDYFAITVDGMFRDKFNEIFLFNRTFILFAGNDDEYNIINDQYLIYSTNGKEIQLSEEIEEKKYTIQKNLLTNCLSAGEKEQLIMFFKKVTTMNERLCKQFLCEADWNLRKAIIDFTIQYKARCIPSRAFIK